MWRSTGRAASTLGTMSGASMAIRAGPAPAASRRKASTSESSPSRSAWLHQVATASMAFRTTAADLFRGDHAKSRPMNRVFNHPSPLEFSLSSRNARSCRSGCQGRVVTCHDQRYRRTPFGTIRVQRRSACLCPPLPGTADEKRLGQSKRRCIRYWDRLDTVEPDAAWRIPQPSSMITGAP